MRTHPLAFAYDGETVGYLAEEPALPPAPGRYRYVPYRSPAHLSLAQAAERRERPVATITLAGRRYEMVVSGFPEVHVVEVADWRPVGEEAG